MTFFDIILDMLDKIWHVQTIYNLPNDHILIDGPSTGVISPFQLPSDDILTLHGL